MTEKRSLKTKTANTLKWNTIDKVSSQVIYAGVGIVLANELSKQDFGLVGVLAVFQAFAMIFVDSGFGAALLQKKRPTKADYSTVFWFNLIVSVGIYLILFFAAPLIADIFHDPRIDIMSKVMFLSFVINGLSIVQTNRLMKRMDMKPVAMANFIGLIVSGIVGVTLACTGCGAWALVWQTVSLAVVKSGMLWVRGGWMPKCIFSRTSLKDIRCVGLSVFSSSLLNTICQQVYSIVIGAFYSLSMLGIYTQAEKWSKMGSASMSQILMSSFVPLLSRVQDNVESFCRYVKRIDRFTACILFPFMIGLAVIGEPLFHFLFGNKWDDAIPLFQILMIRGIFVVLQSLYSNYVLSRGKARAIFAMEVVKDSLTIIAILCTVWSLSLTWLVWGQLIASVMTWMFSLWLLRRATGLKSGVLLGHNLPFFVASVIMGATAFYLQILVDLPIYKLILSITGGALTYIVVLWCMRVNEINDILIHFKSHLRKK